MKRKMLLAIIVMLAFGTSIVYAQTTIEVWFHEYGEAGTAEAVQRYARMFEEEHPDIKVNVEWIPGDYNTKLYTALLSGSSTPDVFETGVNFDENMIEQGYLALLDDLFTEEIKEDFVEVALNQGTINGSVYAIKELIDTGAIYYNKKMLDEAGLEVPKTFEELLVAAEKLTKNGVKGLFIGNDGGSAWGDLLIFASGVPDLVSADGTDFLPDNPKYRDKTITALTALRDLNRSGHLLLGAPADWGDPSSLLYGLTAMKWGGLWDFPILKEEMGDDFAVSAVPPLGEEGKPATFFGGWMSAVNGNSKNIEAAKKFIKWMWIDKNPEVQIDWNTGYGFHIPARKSVADMAEKLVEDSRAQEIVNHTFNNAPLSFRRADWNEEMQTAFNDLISAVIKTDEPIEKLLDNTAAKIEAAMAELNK